MQANGSIPPCSCDNGAESRQCRTQLRVRDSSDSGLDFALFFRAQFAQARWRRLGIKRRSLDEDESRNGAIAEERIDAFDQHRLEMLRLGREGGGDAQTQRAIAPLAARKGEALGRQFLRQL